MAVVPATTPAGADAAVDGATPGPVVDGPADPTRPAPTTPDGAPNPASDPTPTTAPAAAPDPTSAPGTDPATAGPGATDPTTTDLTTTDPPAAPAPSTAGDTTGDTKGAANEPGARTAGQAAPDLGRPAWAVSNPGAGTAITYEPGAGGGLVSDPFGNTFVAGEQLGQIGVRSADGTATAVDAGDKHSVYVAKYHADGSVVAARVIAANAASDTLGGDPLGNVYAVLHGTDVAVPTSTGTRSVGSGAFLVKLRNDLSEVWVVRITPNQTPHGLWPWDAPAAASGNSSGEVAVLAFDTVARVDARGAVIRSKHAADTASVALAEDGTMYEALRSTDVLRATDEQGAVRWTLGSTGSVRGAAVTVGSDGDLTLAGAMTGTAILGNGATPTTLASGNRFTVRLHPDRTAVWAWTDSSGNGNGDSRDDPAVAVGPDGRAAVAFFDGWSSHVVQLDPHGSVTSATTAQTAYWWLPSLRVAVDPDGAVSLQATHARDIVFGTAPDTLTLPRPNLASIFLAHWGPVTPAAAGSLTVTAAFGGAGQPGVWVGVVPSGQAEGTVRWAPVDDAGVARFDGLPPGPYRVTQLDWEGRYARSWFAGATSFATATDVAVVPGGARAITMDLALRPQAGITGIVRDPAGNPLRGITAQLFSSDGFVRATATSEAGVYALTGLTPGAYTVRFLDSSGRSLSAWFHEPGADRSTITVDDQLVVADAVLEPRHVDVAVDVSPTTPRARAGSPFVLAVDVRNLGPDVVPFVDVTPVLPSGVAASYVEGAHGLATPTGWRTAALAAGASTSVLFTVEVAGPPHGPKLDVGARATVTGIDDDHTNDTSSRDVQVIGGERPAGLWATSIHGPGEAIAYGIAVDRSGNTYASGWFRGVVTFGEGDRAVTWSDDRSVPDMWFAKFDPAGALLWVRRGSGYETMDPTGGGVAVATDGSLYVTGFFEGQVRFGDGADQVSLYSNGTQMFLLRFEPDGHLDWARQWGVSSYGWTVAMGPDGLAYVAGRNSGWVYVGAGNGGASMDLRGGVVTAWDRNGQIQHTYPMAGAIDQPQAMARSATVDDDGVLYVVGTLGTSMTFGCGTPQQVTLTSRGGYDGFLAIYERDRSLRSVTQIGGPGLTDRLSGVRPAGDGDTFVSGSLESGATVGSDPTALTSSGGYLIRVGRDGSSRWVRSLGANVRQVVADQFGALYVMGGTGERAPFDVGGGEVATKPTDPPPGGAPAPATTWGPEDAYVAKFYPDGTFDWIVHAGGPARDVAFTAAVDDVGLLHLAGSTSATAMFCIGPDESVVHSEGKTNAFVATCAPPDGEEHPWNDDRVGARTEPGSYLTGRDGVRATVTVTVSNRGPYPSTPADLTFVLPVGAQVIRLGSTAGGATDTGVWHVPVLASGAAAEATAVVLLPPQAVPTSVPIGATLHATDLVPWNNAATTSVVVVNPAPPPPPPPPTTTPTTSPTADPTTTTTSTSTSTTSTTPTSGPTPSSGRPRVPLPQLLFAPTTTTPRPGRAPAASTKRTRTSAPTTSATAPDATSATDGDATPIDENTDATTGAHAPRTTGPSTDDDAALGETARGPASPRTGAADASTSASSSLAVWLTTALVVGWLAAAVASVVWWRRRRSGAATR